VFDARRASGVLSDLHGTVRVTTEEVAVTQTRWCAPCASEQLFEVPPCEDGHGEECLDLCCVRCGHAIVVGVLATDAEVRLETRAA